MLGMRQKEGKKGHKLILGVKRRKKKKYHDSYFLQETHTGDHTPTGSQETIFFPGNHVMIRNGIQVSLWCWAAGAESELRLASTTPPATQDLTRATLSRTTYGKTWLENGKH